MYDADLEFSNEESPPIVKFFQKHAKEGQAIFIRGEESQFSMTVQKELHADIVANSFLDFYDCSVGVELKVRSPRYAHKKDILIETRSCTNPGRESRGWIYTCKADLLAYANLQNFTSLIRLRVLDMPRLQKWFQSIDVLDLPEPILTKQSNHTESYPIPWDDIPPELLLYDGFIDREGNEVKRIIIRTPIVPKCIPQPKVQPVIFSLWEVPA